MTFIDQVRARAMTTHDLARWLLERPDFLIADSGEEGSNPSEAWSAPMDLTNVPYDWPEHTDAISICVLDNGGFDFEAQSDDWKEGYKCGKSGHVPTQQLNDGEFKDGWHIGNAKYRMLEGSKQ